MVSILRPSSRLLLLLNLTTIYDIYDIYGAGAVDSKEGRIPSPDAPLPSIPDRSSLSRSCEWQSRSAVQKMNDTSASQ